jgi:hypothetical protein
VEYFTQKYIHACKNLLVFFFFVVVNSCDREQALRPCYSMLSSGVQAAAVAGALRRRLAARSRSSLS